MTTELRRMQSSRAAAVWRHPGWSGVVAWIIHRVPDCDPTLAAVHAIRNAGRASADAEYARCLAGYLVRVANRSRRGLRPQAHVEQLTSDPPEPPPACRPTDSLAAEAAGVLSAAGVTIPPAVWEVLAPGVDVAVDWWDALAARTGLVGEELVVAARQSRSTTGKWRLSNHFQGPAARPVVALLVGGDQGGRQARQAAGVEAGLLYWSLLARRATSLGHPLPVPPAPIRRAWATSVALIQRTLEPPTTRTGQSNDPTIAA